ncbi:MAG: prolyl oligopeptidase family serine peptidase [Pseudomonadota bacterium]
MAYRPSLGSITLLLCACLLAGVTACSKPPDRPQPVGRAYLPFADSDRPAWSTSGPRPVGTTVWYPAMEGAEQEPWEVGVFRAGWSAPGAPLAEYDKKLPLILLSHGTGGAALQLSWLAETLAANGFLVAAVNHHGNTAAEETYQPQGFMLWWERTLDLSFAIDELLADERFGLRIDPARIGVAGFSLGGYTALSLSGAVTDRARWEAFCRLDETNPSCVPPPEAGLSTKELTALTENDAATKASLVRSNERFRDPRIRAAFVLAPVLAPAFGPESLAAIQLPVRLVVGSQDQQALPATNAEPLAAQIPGAQLLVLDGVAHYTFLARCSLKGRFFVKTLCKDPKGIDRAAIHKQTAADALAFFQSTLPALAP